MAKRGEKSSTRLATKTARVATLLVSGKIISMTVQALMFIVIARLLNPNGYGVYTLVLSIAAFISSLGGINIGVYLNERIPFLLSKRRTHEISVALVDGIIAIIIPGVLIFVIGALASGVLSSYVLHSTAYTTLIVLAMSSIVFSFLYNTTNLILVGFNDGKNNALGSIIYSVAQAIISVALVELGFGIMGAITGYIIALILSSLFQILIAYRRFGLSFMPEGMLSRMREMLRFSMPLTYYNVISALVSNFSVILLGLVVLPGVVGAYGAASRMGSLIDVIEGSIAVALVPMFAEAIHSRYTSAKLGRFFYYSIYFGVLFTAPMIAYVAVFSRYLIVTLFTAQYSEAIIYMQLISIGILLNIYWIYAAQLLISSRRTERVFRYMLMAGIVETASLILLVPLLHVFGVIISTLYVGGIVTDLLYMNYLSKIGISIKLGQVWRIVASNLALAAILFAFDHLPINMAGQFFLLIGIALAVLIYPPVIAKFGAIKKDDIKILYRIGKEVPILGGILIALLKYTSLFI